MDPLDLAALFVRGLMDFFGWPFLSGCNPSGWLLGEVRYSYANLWPARLVDPVDIAVHIPEI
jgi:hypothetical protein